MKTSVLLSIALLLCTSICAQYTLSGTVEDAEGRQVAYANVALYRLVDTSLVKVAVTDNSGAFALIDLEESEYSLSVLAVGYPDLSGRPVHVSEDTELGVIVLSEGGVDLDEVTVTGRRALVEVKPDRTVFNVDGTINAAGNDALTLLRMAPGVTLDNTDRVSILSRSGVIFYVDGRRLPLSGTDLTDYLRNLTSEQIATLEIISSPGAKYEAEGNAGIIDIRLKKAENEGTNATLSASGSQGRYAVYSLNAGGNYRNRHLNLYGNAGYVSNESYTDNFFTSRQNRFLLIDEQYSRPLLRTPSARVGLDLYLGKRHTLGALYSGRFQRSDRTVNNRTDITVDPAGSGTCGSEPDSILRGGVDGRGDHTQNTANLNYNFAIAAGHNLNVDVDYGRYRNDDVLDQPNRYFTPDGRLVRTADAYFVTPIHIDIYTARIDYDFPLGGGTASVGSKATGVSTHNTFEAYDVMAGSRTLDGNQSNAFTYDERVYAAYFNYAGKVGDRLTYSLGLRGEATDARGVLTSIPAEETTVPVDSNYFSLFPSAGITYQLAEKHVLSLRAGRRINRPDYNVLNPFRVQLNELSYEAGNPTLGPEIVNNVQLGYTLASRYNFQLAYSNTQSAIARLFSPDAINPRAGFATYDNLSKRSVYSFSANAPVDLTAWWSVYTSVAASYVSNQANFGFMAEVDVQQFNYNGLMQHTFTLPWALTAELTGRYISAGVSEGIFEYGPLGMVNVGLQRKFLSDQLNVKLSVNDVFRNFVIDGTSNFNGLDLRGIIYRDSRRVALSLSYAFGNQKVNSRRRDTGLDDAAGRVN